MTSSSHDGVARRIVTRCDVEGYSWLPDDAQRDVQGQLDSIEERAAANAGVDRGGGVVQTGGDSTLIAWPPATSDLRLVVDYLREFHNELVIANRTRAEGYQIRVRIAVSAGLFEPGPLGGTGRPAVVATRLVESDEAHDVLRLAPRSCPLAVILDNEIYETVVATGRRALNRDDYVRVDIKDKHNVEHVAWITVPGVDRATLASFRESRSRRRPRQDPDPEPAPETQDRRALRIRRLFRSIRPGPAVTAALITATGGVVVAVIANSGNASAGPSTGTHTTQTVTLESSPPTTSATTTTSSTGTGALYLETTDNRLGTPTFSDDMGDAVNGNARIPFQTQVEVKCWAPNLSGMGSINVFYLIETAPWTGDYAPANTFANSDTSGTLDPKVPKCSS